MIFDRLQLQDFRGFGGAHQIPIHPRLMVVAGVNGAGKSSVLDALASLLSSVVEIVSGGTNSWFGAGDASNVHADRSAAGWEGWVRRRIDGSNTQSLVMAAFRDDEGLEHWNRRVQTHPPAWAQFLELVRNDPMGLPPLHYAYSSSSRLPIRHTGWVELKGRHLAWRGAFDAEAHQVQDLHAWFEQEENIENQEKITRGSLGFELPSLRAVRGALQRFLGGLHGCRLGKVSVLRQHSGDPMKPAGGRLFVYKGEQPLFFDQLSDGERRLLSIVLDLARRMVILNPQLPDPTLAEGVLLIDEVELHLHPQWQRAVVGALVDAFPEMQLILSTHAPLVLASVKNENILVLDNGKVLEGAHTFAGRDPNTILNGPMATPLRPDAVQRSLDELFALVDRSPRKAKKPLRELEKVLGADDPDLVRARALIELLEA